MRVLYVCLDRGVPYGGTKGASVHVEELLRALEAEGHETAIVARAVVAHESEPPRPLIRPHEPAAPGWLPRSTLRRDVRELRARRPFARAVREAIERFRPDVVYERYALFRTEGLEAARSAGVRFALEVNAPLVEEELRFRSLSLTRRAIRAERRLWISADAVVVPSEPLAERVRNAGARRVVVVPNAVDTDRFAPRPVEGARLRKELGLAETFVVAFSGTARPWHDLETLVEALAQGRMSQVALLVVGEAPKWLERFGAERRVRVVATGPVSHAQVAAYLWAANACFAGLPADEDLQYFSPLKAAECLAAARPTVVADAGALSPFARSGAAIGYPPGDVAALADVLERISTDTQYAERLAAAARPHVEGRTWRAAARTIASTLDSDRNARASGSGVMNPSASLEHQSA